MGLRNAVELQSNRNHRLTGASQNDDDDDDDDNDSDAHCETLSFHRSLHCIILYRLLLTKIRRRAGML